MVSEVMQAPGRRPLRPVSMSCPLSLRERAGVRDSEQQQPPSGPPHPNPLPDGEWAAAWDRRALPQVPLTLILSRRERGLALAESRWQHWPAGIHFLTLSRAYGEDT